LLILTWITNWYHNYKM